MSKKLVVSLILILVALNLGAGVFVFYNIRAKADDLTGSAKTAAGSATTQNSTFFGFSASGLPKADVVGVDPAGITRYPKAVRSAYNKTDKIETAEYKVLAPVNVVLWHYKSQLAKNNWVIDFSSPESIMFNKGSQKISVTGTTKSGVTTYTVILN